MGTTQSRRATEARVRADYRCAPAQAGKDHAILLSKNILDFGSVDRPCPINELVQDQITIINNTDESVRFKLEPIPAKSCTLTFFPSHGVLKKRKRMTLVFKFKLNQSENINSKVTLNVEGEAHFIGLKVRCDSGVFGCDPNSHEMVEDSGHRVPRILAQMKECLILNGGLESEGILRLAGDATDIKRVKAEMNNNQFNVQTNYDVNTIASLIKIWYRELPTPVLNALPKECFMNSTEPNLFLEAYNEMPDPNKALVAWLVDFLLAVAEKQAINKMTIQNLAIVLAPNLYEPTGTDPMEGLVLSQKCAQLFAHLLSSRNSSPEQE
jgi:hypothetical protein